MSMHWTDDTPTRGETDEAQRTRLRWWVEQQREQTLAKATARLRATARRWRRERNGGWR